MYSGVSGVGRVFWFFIGQCFITFSQGAFITPLILFFSPLLSFFFVLSLPVLFLLSYPLMGWQLELGLSILRLLLKLITLSVEFCAVVPSWELHTGMLILLLFFIIGKWKPVAFFTLLLSSSLNLDLGKNPTPPTNEYSPGGHIVKIIEKETKTIVYYSDGKCERQLVRGLWWEKCSPRRGSIKKLRKLSYPSSEPRRSSLRG